MKSLLVLVGALVLCVAVTSSIEAQCKHCSFPPPYTYAICADTYYNGAVGCIIGTGGCAHVGSCEGILGPQCPPGNVCVEDPWTCNEPLKNEWRLKSVTVQASKSAAHDGRKPGKA